MTKLSAFFTAMYILAWMAMASALHERGLTIVQSVVAGMLWPIITAGYIGKEMILK